MRIEVRSMIPEAAIVYNRVPQQQSTTQSINLLQLEGYLVSSNYTINFPVLGILNVTGTTLDLEKEIAKRLFAKVNRKHVLWGLTLSGLPIRKTFSGLQGSSGRAFQSGKGE